jgi:hypothetical protein
MKLKVSVAKNLVGSGERLDIPRSIGSQLCCLILAAVLLALPLAGTRIERTPVLAPLVTELVPLGTSLRSPPANLYRLCNLLNPVRQVLGTLSPATVAATADHGRRIQHLATVGFAGSLTTDNPNGRSPPRQLDSPE